MDRKFYDMEKYVALARQAAAEGAVLLKNDRAALPLPEGSRVAVFGRSQFNYYKSGTGSGGLVNTRYVVGIADGLKRAYQVDRAVEDCYKHWLKDHPFDAGNGWAQEPWFQEEMPLGRSLVEDAVRENDAAIVILARTAGEDKDNSAGPGSYLLDQREEQMLQMVCGTFRRTIVLLNVGNIIDMGWVEQYDPAAVLFLWQGGQEGGNGAVDVLTGKVNPSGRLTDTIARDIRDYPAADHYGDDSRNVYAEDIYVGYRYFETFARDKVLYPFGYGLSYTSFASRLTGIRQAPGTTDCQEAGGDRKTVDSHVVIEASITNTGSLPGREVVQVYCGAPRGKLGKPARVLAGFAKTGLLEPGQSENLTMEIPWRDLASYDDAGVTGAKSAWVLEAGEYRFYLGGDVRSAAYGGSLERGTLTVVEQLKEAMAPAEAFGRLVPGRDADVTEAGLSDAGAENGNVQPHICYEQSPVRSASPMEHRNGNLPDTLPCVGDQGYKLWDVAEGRVSMDAFLSQFTEEDLCCLVRGEGMCSPKVTPGTASAFGGVTQRLKGFGLPVACCADGPSGIRMDCGNIAFAMPNGTCLACTWDMGLVQELYGFEGMELRKNHIDTLLGPGMNIHRHPLNGRNFEYFSEDPLLTGRMAVAQLRGMHQYGATGTIKHFACNSQEHRRNFVEAVVSERALREIYLRGFEIAVKEGGARSIMTSYNPINGLWSASNYDMLTRILREQWGYTGIVMTDWWAKGNDEGEEGTTHNVAAMVRAQNDLFMVVTDAATNTGEDNSMEALEAGTVTRGEYLRSAASICRFLLTTPAWNRQQGIRGELDEELEACLEEEGDVILEMQSFQMERELTLAGDHFDMEKGGSTYLQITAKDKGLFGLEVTCRVSEGVSALAQVPMSIFLDQNLLKTFTLTGEDKEWRKVQIDFPAVVPQNTFHLKVYFGQSGMEVKEFKIRMLGMEA